MASTYLKRTNGTPTNDKIGTISLWVKRSKLGTDQRIHMNFADGSNYAYLRFTEGDLIEVYGVASGSQSTQIRTNRKFRDTNAWYHIVLAIDTTQGTSTDRIKIYVNGVQETSMGTTDYWGQNETCQLLIASGSNYHTVGSAENGSSSFDGSMSHYHKCDGTALAPTVFGETDSTTGEWKIKTNVSFTPGNNGYTILKDGNTITDQSANSNDFTLGAGTLTKTEDCPSNVFATLNPLMINRLGNDGVYSNGNTKLTMTASNANRGYGFSTLGVTQGKWYWEVKVLTPERAMVGVGDAQFICKQTSPYYDINPSYGIALNCTQGALNYNNTSTTSYHGSAVNANDIIQVALNMDNHLLWYGINGTWLNSATQTEIENNTATNDVTTDIGTQNVINNGEFIFPFVADISTSGKSNFETNFGNGYFGTTAVSSAGTNASGNGIFEYDVPTGYTALSTKGLNL